VQRLLGVTDIHSSVVVSEWKEVVALARERYAAHPPAALLFVKSLCNLGVAFKVPCTVSVALLRSQPLPQRLWCWCLA
jgi:hypothetical protein